MYGTVIYFTENLKATIMNNLVIEHTSPLHISYVRLKREILNRKENDERISIYLTNLERAFNDVREELLGHEEELNEN